MRLEILEHGHSRSQKMGFWLIRRILDPVPGPILVMSYRREFFGKPMAGVLQTAMRGSREWSLVENELFSAFVSEHNRCRF